MTMQRYSHLEYDQGLGEDDTGEWVRFTDAQAAIQRARDQDYPEIPDSSNRGAIQRARDQALEDAAARVGSMPRGLHPDDYAAAIRTMKGDTDDR